MSAICLSDPRAGTPLRRTHSGFSLVETLVVLLLMGLLAGIAMPRLASLYVSLQENNRMLALRTAIQAAPSHAYLAGEALDLATYLESAALVPDGWSLYFEQPIEIRANGFCAGGAMSILTRGSERSFQITAPYCALREG